ncbi:hypothetical protein [Streptomyces sp. NBC_00690]|uniref:hypothetical protein n=1 Tax=Streptomyces sp. NBC_00690 TaxID=2975808 RepID=UPI002E28B4CC|nr:hypothetical protein [Streptomyces sp. NBC_00690]
MLAVAIGALVAGFGMCLATNGWNLADRIFDSPTVPTGSATPRTIRLVGGIVIIVGLFWIGTALSEALQPSTT